jgi:hypothetical protein
VTTTCGAPRVTTHRGNVSCSWVRKRTETHGSGNVRQTAMDENDKVRLRLGAILLAEVDRMRPTLDQLGNPELHLTIAYHPNANALFFLLKNTQGHLLAMDPYDADSFDWLVSQLGERERALPERVTAWVAAQPWLDLATAVITTRDRKGGNGAYAN